MSTPLADIVATIRAAPDGPRVAAVFDYDGTLIDGFSGLSYIRERIKRLQLRPSEAAKIAEAAIRGVRTPEEFSDFLNWSLGAFEGQAVEALSKTGQEIFDGDIASRLRPETWALLELHRLRGHTLILASSGTSLQLEAIAKAADISHVVATQLENVDGRYTGAVSGQAPWGPHKASQVAALAETLDVDLAQSFAYSDGDEDIPLLTSVGHPTAVNPRPRMRKEATAQGWPIIHGQSVGGTVPLTAPARTAAMLYGVAGGTALSGPVGLLKRSARAFIDSSIGLASDLGLTLGGVDIEVVAGEHHLEEARPCVFIFNHRSNLDGLVLMNLLRKDVTAIAKAELKQIPGVGQLFGMSGVAFIDRSDSRQAREAIQPVLEMVRDEGLSLALAPEGTRWRTPGMGPFKKGAFHIAAQAGVPVVPVVMAGCGERLPPGTALVRPGTVRVQVLEPIDVSSWERKHLGDNVTAVREEMLLTLIDLIAG
ncbi:HAD-IB family hydrolase [Euzebya tangerina]|uniref:HAD-IB family hydrolase n=1 Tax=Euzebya tangerina TaxID=591198 RepID=UPI000E31753A|nr:HAD-IB family hydrolase [Euzebya tangerina]